MSSENIERKNKCVECNKRGYERAKLNIVLCKNCAKLPKYLLICTTKAKKQFFLEDEEFDDLEYMEGSTGYSFGFYYYLEEVKRVACEKHNTDIANLENVISRLNIEKQERIERRTANGIERRNIATNKRKAKLIKSLNNYGLELRSDSELCKKYIAGDIKELDDVVHRMCQMKYLYEYCHMDECKNIAYKNHIDELNAGYGPDCSVSEAAEFIALNKYSNRKYPDVWPWMKNL